VWCETLHRGATVARRRATIIEETAIETTDSERLRVGDEQFGDASPRAGHADLSVRRIMTATRTVTP